MCRLYLFVVIVSVILEVIFIFFNNYWILKRLYLDEGVNFIFRLIKELYDLYNNCNFKRILYDFIGNIRGDMLGILELNKKILKKRYVYFIVCVCNSIC